jgi:hypothetical protein
LVSLLSSASVMNGSIGRGTQSIWSLLEKLRAPKHLLQGGGEEHAEQEGEVEGDGGGDAGEGREKWDRSDDEDSSVMVHSPLIPGADSKVLLADSDMVPVLEEVETDPHSDNPQSGPSQLGGEPLPKKPSQGLWTQLKTWRVKTHRVWTPSPTNISLQATWWGFRM